LNNSNVIKRTFVGSKGSSNQHGGNVAHILAHPKVEGSPVWGLIPYARVFLNDVDNSKGQIYTSYLVSAILDAIELNVDIISISLGTSEQDLSMDKAIQKAVDKGILVFAAAGNSGIRLYEFPGACENAIGVGSINLQKGLSVFNTRNDNISVFAPGENLKMPSGTVSGTSFACPFAAGLAALVLCNMREIDKNPKARVSKDTMIDILRNPDHLGLSCKVHN
jgi:subtilisin family serine protease